MKTLTGAIEILRKAERHPCSLCRLEPLCGGRHLACRTMDRFNNDGKIKDYDLDWPSREVYNTIFCDLVPYNMGVHGP